MIEGLTVDGILIVCSLLVFISIIASKISSSWGIPTLLIFLGISMLAGSDGIGHIEFDDPYTVQVLGNITLCILLFHGGLTTDFVKIAPALKCGILLSTIGVVVTILTLGCILHIFGIFNFRESLLMGSLVASTDAAVVFSILNTKNLNIRNNLDTILEFESGSNDPMAYFVVHFLIQVITGGTGNLSILSCIALFTKGMILGALMGGCMGFAMKYIVTKVQLNNEAFFPGIVLAMTLFTYGFTNYIQGNGFLAVYIAGITLGRDNFLRKNRLIWFFESVSWILQMLMFISLGLLINPHQLPSIFLDGILTAIVLICIARPTSVFVSLFFMKHYSINDKLFLSFVGLRGATSIVFATFPLLAEIPSAEKMFNIVFFVVIVSILCQGTTIPYLAKKLDILEK